MTGFTTFEPSLAGKWVQLLKELNPQIRRVAVLCNPETTPTRAAAFVREIDATTSALAVQPVLTYA
jgi:putative ABC transport system substrate-binding protein